MIKRTRYANAISYATYTLCVIHNVYTNKGKPFLNHSKKKNITIICILYTYICNILVLLLCYSVLQGYFLTISFWTTLHTCTRHICTRTFFKNVCHKMCLFCAKNTQIVHKKTCTHANLHVYALCSTMKVQVVQNLFGEALS